MSEQAKITAVVGVDFDDSGDDAIVEGLRWLGQDPRRVLHALYVIDPDRPAKAGSEPAMLARAEVLARAPEKLAAWIAQLAQVHTLPCDKRVQAHARIGEPVDTLLQFAVDYDASIMIVGTNGRRGINRMLLGSVAETLVRNARCPVLVARPIDYTDATKTKLPDAAYPPGQEPPIYPSSPPGAHRDIATQHTGWQHNSGRPTGFRIV